MPKNFYIFRHGLASKNPDGYGDQALTAQILPEGIPAINKLAQFLKDHPSDFNISSPVARCTQTSKIVFDMQNKKFITDSRLSEFFNETLDQLIIRVKDFLQELEQSQYTSVAICTHGTVIAALTHLIIDNEFSIDQFYDFPQPSGLVIIKNKQIQTMHFNEIK